MVSISSRPQWVNVRAIGYGIGWVYPTSVSEGNFLQSTLQDQGNCGGKPDLNILFRPHVLAIYRRYRKTSSISHTKSLSLNVSCIFLQLPSLNPLKPGVKLRMKMLIEKFLNEFDQWYTCW